MKLSHFIFLLSLILLTACEQKPSTPASNTAVAETMKFQNDAHELVYKMTQKVGTYDQLKVLKDVSYTYTYTTPDGKKDISSEKYVFDGELSYAEYTTHERSLADLEGPYEQGYDGTNAWLKHKGEYSMDEAKLKRALFNRKTNFYWFTMMQKLTDPGLTYSYIRADTIDNKMYDVVNVTFESNGETPTDIYQLFINKESLLVDQFLFTVADFGVMEEPFLMKVDYQNVNGIMIPAQRKYAKANWEGEHLGAPWINVVWSDIKFDQGLSKVMFEKK